MAVAASQPVHTHREFVSEAAAHEPSATNRMNHRSLWNNWMIRTRTRSPHPSAKYVR